SLHDALPIYPHALRECSLRTLRRNVGAGIATREDLSGVHGHLGIEGLAPATLRVEVLRTEDPEHEMVLLEADAVLAGERAAGVDRDLEDLGARLHHPVDWLGPRVEQQHRVQVPVADVEPVR